jgi:hypothetical protein
MDAFYNSLSVTQQTAFNGAVVGFVGSWLLYFTIPYVNSLIFASIFKNLTKPQRMRWNILTVSCIHAIISAQGIIRALLFESYADPPLLGVDDPTKNGGYATPLRFWYLGLTLGYAIEDQCAMLLNADTFSKDLVIMTVHHVLLIVAYLIGFTYHTASYIMACLQAVEVANPTIYIRWWLDAANQKESLAYMINGAVMVLAYFLVRFLWNTYTFYTHVFEIMPVSPSGFWPQLLMWIGVFYCLMQYYFFYLVISGAFSYMSKRKPKKQE